MTKYLNIAFQSAIVKESIKVAIVVGTILNLINQGHAILSMHINDINFQKLGLTFCVPYVVSTYASVMTELRKK